MLSTNISLLEPDELSTLLQQQDLLLVQVTQAEIYQQAHISDAKLVVPSQLVCGIPPATGRLPDEGAVEALLTSIGYSPEQHIVVYDDEGGGWAGRMAWTLDIVGHTRWSYLNGGLHSWARAGLPLQQGPWSAATNSLNETVHFDYAPVAEIEDILKAIEDPNQTIWDVRSAEEYRGDRQAAARVGHIPGAVNLDWLHLKDPQDAQRLTITDIEGLASAGVPVESRLITHCQTHHRSGLSYMLGRLLGLDIRAYHGSWSEWGNRNDTPIELPVNLDT